MSEAQTSGDSVTKTVSSYQVRKQPPPPPQQQQQQQGQQQRQQVQQRQQGQELAQYRLPQQQNFN